MDWLENPWLVGIGGGLLSGLAVTWLSRIILSRKDRGEYVQKLKSANREITHAVRPGISEGLVPERRVVLSLINATARKYAVDTTDLHSPDEIQEELTKEIMDSSFISAKTKQEYYNQLISLIEIPTDLDDDSTIKKESILESKSSLAEYRSRTIAMMSVLLGSVTALMTALLVLSEGSISELYDPIPASLIPALIAVLATSLMAFMTILRREYRRLSLNKSRTRSMAGSSSESGNYRLTASDLKGDSESTRTNEERA